MKAKNIFLLSLVAATGLVSCEDDFKTGRVPGGSYISVCEAGAWEKGRSTRAGVEAPMELQTDINAEPIYLHTEITDTKVEEIACGPETRGLRRTGDVFSTDGSDNKLHSIGLYGKLAGTFIINGDEVNLTSGVTKETSVNPDYEDSHYEWFVKEYQIPTAWEAGQTGDFYGYSPYFTPGGFYVWNSSTSSFDSSADTGLKVSVEGGVPTLTYNTPASETQQIDVLTALDANVPKAREDDIKLRFYHVLSAIKFKMKPNSNDNKSFVWNVGGTDRYVQVKSITLSGIYKNGTWPIGADIRNTLWTKSGESNGTFVLSTAGVTLAQDNSTDNQELNNDNNCLMLLPQTLPEGAKIRLTCDLYSDAACTTKVKENAWMESSLEDHEWLPGHTYTYILSLSSFRYVFDYNTETEKIYNNVNTDGNEYNNGSGTLTLPESNVFIRSYKIDSDNQKTPVGWHIEHQEYDEYAVGTPSSPISSTNPWKPGSNGWIHVYDKSSGNYDTEVTLNHVGAREEDADNVRLFQISIGSIMTPVYDLSLWNYDQKKRWTGRSTSNCYIVAGPGTYRIPLIYGNAYTNGVENTTAWNPSNSGTYALRTFLNHNDVAIQSPFINIDLAQKVTEAVLIWEEGVGTNENTRKSMGAGSTTRGESGDAYGYNYNKGTVIKVFKELDNFTGAPDGYNSATGFAQNAKYLKFEISPTNFKYGNAVVGVRDNDGKIVWSWHIWITDPTLFTTDQPLDIDGHSVTFAGTNIGWVVGDVDVPQKNRTGKVRLVQDESQEIITIDATQVKCNAFKSYFTNVLYQWGRKDPMRGNVDSRDMEEDYGSPRGEAGAVPWTNMYEQPYPTVGSLIENPNKIYGQSDGDLYSSSPNASTNKSYCNLWAATLQQSNQAMWGSWKFYGKTIYDPSPVGYCVPPSRYLMTLTRRQYRNWEEMNTSSTLPLIVKYNNTLNFYTSGIRSTTAGGSLKSTGYIQPKPALEVVKGDNAKGFFHTCTPYSRDESFQLHLYFYGGAILSDERDTHNKILGDLSETLSVFPVKWNGEIVGTEENPLEQYLTFTFSGAGGALYWDKAHSTSGHTSTIEWSDDGTSWHEVISSYGGTNGKGTLIKENIPAGGKIYVRGNNNTYCEKSSGTYYYNYFYSTAAYDLSGNIMSLINSNKEVFKNMEVLPAGTSYNFCSLFYNPQGTYNRNEKIEDISELVLPATTLTPNCYESMFQGCTQLVMAPILPAETGQSDCYKNMFKGCSSLQSVTCMLKYATSTDYSSYTSGWLDGVNSTGEFYYKNGANWPTNTSGIGGIDYGIPSGWTKFSD